MSDVPFTGERIHNGNDRFALDLARHRAAYEVARTLASGGRVLDLGCGSGHGTALHAADETRVFGLDRVFPDSANRTSGGNFVRGDLLAIPLRSASFDLVESFQVIEHLEDAAAYVDAIAELVRPEGVAVITTPNILTSDGVNPYHVHEYRAEELAELLGRRFAEVEMRGIWASESAQQILDERSSRIQRVMKLDPLRLRERVPVALIHWLFARFGHFVRRPGSEAPPEVRWQDFRVGPAGDDCLDLLALCRKPRSSS